MNRAVFQKDHDILQFNQNESANISEINEISKRNKTLCQK